LTTSLKLQQALNNKYLGGSERMSVSGSNGVMGNPSGELIGSNAALVHLAHRLDTTEPVNDPYPVNKLLVQAGWVF